MKILVVVNEFPPGPGGIGTHAHEMVKQLVLHQNDLIVIGPQNYSSPDAVKKFNGKQPFQIIPLTDGIGQTLSPIRRFLKLIQTFYVQKPDVIVASGSNAIWMSMIIRLFSSVKFVAIVHGGELTFTSKWRRIMTRLGCRMSSGIISVSQYTADILLRDGISSEKIAVIRNGANEQFFKNLNKREALKWKYNLIGKKVILTVGSVSERKGQDVVIKAMEQVARQLPEVMYLMSGRSNDFEFYKSAAQEAKVLDYVRFLDVVSNDALLDYYNLSDLFVLTSRHSSDGDFEGFGIVVIEAALCGIPAVVTNGSGLVEAIEVNETGLVVEPDNINQTAEAIIRLLTDETLRIKLAKAAQNRAEQSYTWNKVGTLYNQYFQNLL